MDNMQTPIIRDGIIWKALFKKDNYVANESRFLTMNNEPCDKILSIRTNSSPNYETLQENEFIENLYLEYIAGEYEVYQEFIKILIEIMLCSKQK